MNDKNTTMKELLDLARKFREERGWEESADLKDYPLGLVLEAAEVLELFQWMSGEEVEANDKLRPAIGEELADVLYWVLSLADRLGIDMSSAFEQKLLKQAEKYPLSQFGKDVPRDARERAYYKLKARTRGGHPLASDEDDL